MPNNIKYFLYDSQGKDVGFVILPCINLATIIIELDGVSYRPLHYNLVERTCVCVPVKVVTVERMNEGNGVERAPLVAAKATA